MEGVDRVFFGLEFEGVEGEVDGPAVEGEEEASGVEGAHGCRHTAGAGCRGQGRRWVR